ncbi:hypothetical protein PanWU01x14_019090 [Parasponia andersonii]|uniref:Uncharacterized protein n=1 Tax=Parasponia andersonii TaxID=3476 RepID=A0A2P5DZC6_PARAD|nr:hypothetical protein PanWU01x14_019090 [Parasponia andersonii]
MTNFSPESTQLISTLMIGWSQSTTSSGGYTCQSIVVVAWWLADRAADIRRQLEVHTSRHISSREIQCDGETSQQSFESLGFN